MIQESRNVAELEALERHLRMWQEHSLYQNLLAVFAARIRALVTASEKERSGAPRVLTTHESRRVAKQIVRAATIPELDAVVDRIRLRYLVGVRRDEVENLARLRRERLERLAAHGQPPTRLPA
jgi:hypothetical protein